MDPEELRKSLVEENKSKAVDVETFEEGDDLDYLMRTEAKKIRAHYNNADNGPDRRRYKERYEQLAAWIEEYAKLSADESAQSKLRATILDAMRRWRQSGETDRKRAQEVEQGRRDLNERGKAGAGENTHKRIRDEISYLLKNYRPENEAKIEALIDKWRTSGDPSYDPQIKLKLRAARRKKNQSDYAL